MREEWSQGSFIFRKFSALTCLRIAFSAIEPKTKKNVRHSYSWPSGLRFAKIRALFCAPRAYSSPSPLVSGQVVNEVFTLI